jgi:hypothetical protein
VPDYAQARINVYSAQDSSLLNTIPLVQRPGGRSWVLRGNDTLTYRAVSITRDSLGGDAKAAESPNVEVWDRWPAITAVRRRPGQHDLGTAPGHDL